MSRDDFEQRAYVAKINAGGAAREAALAAAEARDWWEATYRKKSKAAPVTEKAAP